MSVGAPPRTSRGPSTVISRSRSMGRARLPREGVRRDLEVLQRELRDLLESGRRDDAAPDRAVWLVPPHEDPEARIAVRDDSDKGGHVAAGRVTAARVRLRGGPGLARHLVAVDLCLDP